MIKFIAFFLLAISVTFCTVHKRVHRRGWYVEWNKPLKGSGVNSEEKKTVNEHFEVLTADTEEMSEAVFNGAYEIENELVIDSTIQPEDLNEALVLSKISDLSKNAERQGVKARKDIPDSKKADSEDEKLVNESGTMVSVIMIIGAAVLAGIMTFLILNIAAFQSALLATVGIIVLGTASLLFLTLGLFLLIRRGVEKKHPEKRAKRQARIDKRESKPNYNPNRFNIILGVVVVAIVTVLFGWIIGVKE
jgi:hypothetical protein